MLRPSRERLENAALEGSGSSAKRNKLPLAPSTPAVSKSAETRDVRRPVLSPWKQRKVCGATRQQAAIGGFTLQHPLGMAITCQVRNPSPPRSAGPICQGNLAPLPSSVSISDSKVLGGCFAWQCALLRPGTGSLGSCRCSHPRDQPWSIFIREVKSMQRSFSLLVFKA